MTVLFENRYRLTDDILDEYVRRVVCRDLIKGCVIGAVICSIGTVAAFFFSFWRLRMVIGCCTLVLLSSAAALPFLARHQMRRNSSGANSRQDHTTSISFGDGIVVDEVGTRSQYKYDQITRVRVFQHFSVLEIGKSDAIILSNCGFIKGSRAEFWRFMRSARPDLKMDEA